MLSSRNRWGRHFKVLVSVEGGARFKAGAALGGDVMHGDLMISGCTDIYMGVSINGGSPKWLIFVREYPMKMDDN